MGIIGNLLGDGAGKVIDAVGNAIDKNFTTDAERKTLDNAAAKDAQQHETEVANIGIQNTKNFLGDVDSVRVNQSRVQETDKASWLSKNVQPLLAVSVIGLTFWLYWYIIFSGSMILKVQPEMKDIIIYVLGALTTVSTQVVSYFFGSSQGSSDKQKLLTQLTNK